MSKTKVHISNQIIAIMKDKEYTILKIDDKDVVLVGKEYKNVINFTRVEEVKNPLEIAIEYPESPEPALTVDSVITFDDEGNSIKIELKEPTPMKTKTGVKTPERMQCRNAG